MAAMVPAMAAPAGMTAEAMEYMQEMIRLNLVEHDKEIAKEMDSRDALTRSSIAGEIATLKAMTESLHSETGAA